MFKGSWRVGLCVLAAAALFGCAEDDGGGAKIISSGAFDTPVSAGAPAPAGPGEAYEFTFTAEDGDKLTLATMFVFSNDLFYGPDGGGIDLFDSAGAAVTGDVTAQIFLWDAGTEVNQMPDGSGSNQANMQAAPNTGPDENGVVGLVADSGDGFTYPALTDTIRVTLAYAAGTFTATIDNLTGTDLTPISPGVYAVFTGMNPLFKDGKADRGEGLEALAEDGDPSTLAANLAL